jgi:Tfp pilus assembly protein PilO
MKNKKENNISSKVAAAILSALMVWGASYLADEYYFNGRNKEVLEARSKLTALKTSNDENERIKQNYDKLEQSLSDAEHTYNTLKFLIPSEAELPQILQGMETAAYNRNLKFDHFSQGTAAKQTGALTELPLTVEVVGFYDDVRRYLDDFVRYERVLCVNKIHMQQEQLPDAKALTMRATINFSAFLAKEKGIPKLASNTGAIKQ